MVIDLNPKVQAPVKESKFKLKDIEQLFIEVKENWKEFYLNNKKRLDEHTIDVYDWCVFPLYKKEGPFYRCLLHPMVEVHTGTKIMNFKFENIHYAEFISHCVSYKPEEHKQYIIEKLLKTSVTTSATRETNKPSNNEHVTKEDKNI